MDENKQKFLEELTELSKKYGYYIDGCGCCDSPYLIEQAPKYSDGELKWSNEEQKYECNSDPIF